MRLELFKCFAPFSTLRVKTGFLNLGLFLALAAPLGAQLINLQTQVKNVLPGANGGTNINTTGVTGCPAVTAGVWSFSLLNCAGPSSGAAGGNFSVQYANGNAFGGVNFTGFVYNNGSAQPPTSGTQANVLSLWDPTTCATATYALLANGLCGPEGATLAHTTHLIAGDGAGNGADSGIAVSAVPFLTTSNSWTNTNAFTGVTDFLALAQTSANTNATSGANVNPPPFQESGQYWNGSSSQSDSWNWAEVLGSGTNPTSTYTLNHSGSPGVKAVAIPFPITVTSCTGCGGGLTAVTASAPLASSGGATPNLTITTGTANGVAGLDASSCIVIPGVNGGKICQNSSTGISIFDAAGNQLAWLYPGGESNPIFAFGNPGISGGAFLINGPCHMLQLGANFIDGGISFGHCAGLTDPFASLQMQIDPGGGPVDIGDWEPDFHGFKLHDNGNAVLPAGLTFIGGASSTNCGTGAVFDFGSNDGAGRLVVGSTPPALCKIKWQYAYNVEVSHVFENAAPHCSVNNEGQRALGSIVLTSNPTSGDTITVTDGSLAAGVITFGTNVAIGSTAAVTATNLYNYMAHTIQGTPGAAPGIDSVFTHFDVGIPSGGTVALTYTYMDGVTGNAVTLSTSDIAKITVPANLSGGVLASARTVVASPGTGGMVILAPGGTLNAGDVISYHCQTFW
jgi:hypothetical protein